jgi:hypothetical protein
MLDSLLLALLLVSGIPKIRFHGPIIGKAGELSIDKTMNVSDTRYVRFCSTRSVRFVKITYGGD